MAGSDSYMGNYLKRTMIRQMLNPTSLKDKNAGDSSVSGMANLADVSPGVNPGTVFSNQRLAQNLAQEQSDQQAEELQKNKISLGSQARIAATEAKGEQDFENKRRQVGLDVKKAFLMNKMGLSPNGSPGRSLAARSGYKNMADVPTTGPGGLPLESAEENDYGYIKPKYGRTKESQSTLDMTNATHMANQDAIAKTKADADITAQKKAADPGILKNMRNFFWNPDSENNLKQQFAKSSQQAAPDYENMTADDLDTLARKGDQKAFAVGKQKFGKS